MKDKRGVYEKIPGSGVWWIRFMTSDGKIRREKAGTKSAANARVERRRQAVLENEKLPLTRHRVVPFSELADDYLEYVQTEGRAKTEGSRIAMFREAFGDRRADIPIADLRAWFASKAWSDASYNRSLTVLSLIYKLAVENEKLQDRPTDKLKRKKAPTGRVRYLNQFAPDEEVRLRAAIAKRYPLHLPEFVIALNTGMRSSEQYQRITWQDVDFLRRALFIPDSKSGKSRHIPLNDDALEAFRLLRERTGGEGPIFQSERRGKRLLAGSHWFDIACLAAGLRPKPGEKDPRRTPFTWHCLRHTFASRLAMADAAMRTIADLMGHAAIQQTMSYAHLAPKKLRDAVDRMGALNRAEILTDTSTDTEPESRSHVDSIKVQ